jgi:D-alanyl-D-alanine carboxypeptidase
MAISKAALVEIVNRSMERRGAAGIAVVSGPGVAPEAIWIPASASEEPAYLAYSITKTVTAALVLQMRDERRLTLEDRLARWFPGIAGSDRISLRQVLNHTAGIPDYGGLASYHEAVRTSPSAPWSFERFAAETFDKGLRFDPGSGWAYSNPGYMLLKRIAEAVAGSSFADTIRDRIVRTLGLARTFLPASRDDLARLAPATSRALAPDGAPRDVRDHYHPGWVAHGVVASTPSEIARFFDALFGGALLSPQSLRDMTTLVPVGDASAESAPRWRKPSYGRGIMGDPESAFGRLWGHNGGGPGYTSSAFHAPDLGGISVCAMCAVEGDATAEQIVFTVLSALAASTMKTTRDP